MVGTGVSTRPTLSNGSTGSYVTELQNLLNSKGFSLTVDGIFGNNTEAAVREFQKRHSLVADGIVGSRTWEVLLRPIGPQPPIKLVDVCQYYEPSRYPHQTSALNWLQSQLTDATLDEFARRWRLSSSTNPAPIKLTDVCQYYDPSRYPHQTSALNWLQNQISQATLEGFARRWRNQI